MDAELLAAIKQLNGALRSTEAPGYLDRKAWNVVRSQLCALDSAAEAVATAYMGGGAGLYGAVSELGRIVEGQG